MSPKGLFEIEITAQACGRSESYRRLLEAYAVHIMTPIPSQLTSERVLNKRERSSSIYEDEEAVREDEDDRECADLEVKLSEEFQLDLKKRRLTTLLTQFKDQFFYSPI